MGNNSKKKFNHEQHYSSMSMKELSTLIKQHEEFMEKFPDLNSDYLNNYYNMLKKRVSDRIGKGKTK